MPYDQSIRTINYHYFLLLPDNSSPSSSLQDRSKATYKYKEQRQRCEYRRYFLPEKTFSHVILIDAYPKTEKGRLLPFISSRSAPSRPPITNFARLPRLCLERELMIHPVQPASQIEVARAERVSRRLD